MVNTSKGILPLLILIITFLTVPVHASSSEWGPWDRDQVYSRGEANTRTVGKDQNPASSIAVFPGIQLITFFQTVISPVDGATCDFYPTCSAYAKQALQKHGLFIGLIMASERLCRYHTYEGYEPIVKYGSYYSYDPVENNDFWFTQRRASPP